MGNTDAGVTGVGRDSGLGSFSNDDMDGDFLLFGGDPGVGDGSVNEDIMDCASMSFWLLCALPSGM